MRQTTILCDICYRPITGTRWDELPQPLRVLTTCGSQNPMGDVLPDGHQTADFIATEVCPHCQKEVARAVAGVILHARARTLPTES